MNNQSRQNKNKIMSIFRYNDSFDSVLTQIMLNSQYFCLITVELDEPPPIYVLDDGVMKMQ